MGVEQGRALCGASLGGLPGLILGAVFGGLVASPSEPLPDTPEKGICGPNPAAGFEVLAKPVGGALDEFHWLIGIALGGAFGAMVGGVIGAGIATSEDGQSSTPPAPSFRQRYGTNPFRRSTERGAHSDQENPIHSQVGDS